MRLVDIDEIKDKKKKKRILKKYQSDQQNIQDKRNSYLQQTGLDKIYSGDYSNSNDGFNTAGRNDFAVQPSLWEQIKTTAGNMFGNVGYGLGNGLIGFAQNERRNKTASNALNMLNKMNVSNPVSQLFNAFGDLGKSLESTLDFTLKNNNTYNSLKKANEDNKNTILNFIDEKLQNQEDINNENIQKNIQETTNPVGQKLVEIAPSIGQMIPSAIPGVGTLYSVGSATDSYYDEAKARGMNDEQASNYSQLMGMAEGLTEMIGVGKLVKGGKGIAKGTIKEGFKDLGISIADNFIQEAVTEPISEVVTKGTAGDEYLKNDYRTSEGWKNLGKDMLQSGFDGAITAGIMGGVSAGLGKSINVYNKLRNGQQPTANEYKSAFDEQRANGIDVDGNIQNEFKNRINQSRQGANQNTNQVANTQQDIATRLNEIVQNDKYLSQEDKEAMIYATNDLASKNQLDSNNTLEAINQIKQMSQLSQEQNDQLDIGKKYLSGRKEIYNKYRSITDYDNLIVQQAKDVVPSNKQGKRTKEQWLDVAKYIGTNIADKSNSEIQEIAYKSWQEETPNNSATLNKQGQKYVKFMADDWIDTIYDAVEKQRQKSGYVANNDTVSALDNFYKEYTNNQTAQNLKDKNIENINNNLYNINKDRGDINEQVQREGMAGVPKQYGTGIQQKEKQQNNKSYTRKEYEEFEKSVKQIESNKLTEGQRKLIDNYKGQYNKNIVFFDGQQNNNGYLGGASLNDKNKIYVDVNSAKTFGENKIINHELMESDILHNRKISNDIIQPAIQKIIDDPEFQNQKLAFWENQEGEIPSDYAIAKDILCDRFAEIRTGEKLDYNNVLSQETNMNIDFALEKFYKSLYGKDLKENSINKEAKPSIEQPGAWQSFLENQIGPTGKGKTVQELRLPTKETINNKKVDAYNILYQDNNQINKFNVPIADGGKVRKHYKSIMQSSNTSPEAKAIAKKLIGSDTYVPDSNKRQLETADNRIMSNGADNEAVTLATKVKNNDKITADDIAVGERLIEYYSKTGEKEKLQDAIQNVALAGTQAGQTVQAMSLINRQTPQGQAVYLSKVVDRMNKQIEKRTKGKGQQFDLTPEMLDKITNSSKENLEKNIDEVARELAKQVPKTTMEKIDSWRYFSMLANPRTHIRNIIGNLSMANVQTIKNKVAGGLESIAQKTGMIDQRTKSLKPASKEVKAFAKADVENVLGRLNNESKFDTKNLIQQYQRTFKSNVLENTLGKLYNLNSKALETEDTFGLKNAYRKALADYMTANKLTEKDLTAGTKEADIKLENARKYAIEQAQEATFHQYSALASWLNTLENKNNATKLLAGAIIPFKKTPVNVAKTGIEYSPIGVIKSFTTDIAKLRKGEIDVNKYIDNLSKGLTGSAITVAGYALAQAGILSASGDDDDQKNQYYQEDRGNQSFSIKIGDKTYSLDWLSPTAIPLFIGAQLNDNVKNAGKEQTTEDILDKISNSIDAMSSAMNPMIEMSMLSGVASAVKSFAQGDAQFFQNLLINSGKSYVNQFFPTLGGQIAKMVDDTERSTTSTKKNMFAKAVDSTGKQILNKIPFASKLLPAKTDVWGNEVKRDDNLLYRALQQAVFPWSEKTLKSTKVDNSISDLYEKTGDNSVLPNTSINKDFTINSEKYRLNADEYANYKKEYGKTSYNLLNKLTNSSEYKNMTDEQKTKAISEIYSYANEKNKVDYANKNKLDVKTSTTYKAIEKIKKAGGNESDYFKYIGSTTGIDKQKEKMETLSKMTISDKSKSAIYQTTFGSDDEVYNYVLSKSNIDISEYLKYKTQEFTSDKKDDGTLTGKSITNSKKNKVFKYVNNMPLTYEERLVILGQQYKLGNQERQDLYDYINSINIKASDKLKIYDKMQGFTVYKSGRVKY